HGPGWARSRLPFLARTFTGRSPLPPSAANPPSTSSSSSSSSSKNKPDNIPADNSNDTMDTYYALLSSTLEFQPTPETLPDLDAYAVDEAKGIVSVRLKGGFAAKKKKKKKQKGRADEEEEGTGRKKERRRAWTEEWVYLVRFEAQGEGEEEEEEEVKTRKRRRKIERLDIWADPLSAWVAVGGGEEVEEEEEKEGG
ncbi:MAG: hypothetical protein Q9197_003364, partial [Variospora fuerteventurae]